MKDRTVRKIEPVRKPAVGMASVYGSLRVAVYARVSTESEDQKSSFVAQQEYYETLVSEHPNWTLVNVYADNGISGLNIKNRSGFKEMMEDCLAGNVDLVLTKSISRFARNTVDTVTAIRKLKEKGVAI